MTIPATRSSVPSSSRAPDDPRPRFLSEADCQEIAQRLVHFTRGGGSTLVDIRSSWVGNVRWGRNRISTSGEVQENLIRITRTIRGAESGLVVINETSDTALIAAARRAERLVATQPKMFSYGMTGNWLTQKSDRMPALFSDATYQMDAERRAAAAFHLAHSAEAAGMLSAGYIEVAARGAALIDTRGTSLYCPYTEAQYSVTVRSPDGSGSGWAGVDWNDWNRIDGEKISQIALDKCLRSQHPVRLEPGRYTTILEPQAVCGLVNVLVNWGLKREDAESDQSGSPFFDSIGVGPDGRKIGLSKLGKQVIDRRITISSDPFDPDYAIPPFGDMMGTDPYEPNRPVVWIREGILNALSYNRGYALLNFNSAVAQPNPYSYRMTGGDTSVEEMIATTKRGVLVTRFVDMQMLYLTNLLSRGYTRDGLWLIENGKISHPIKNLVFTESVLFALNKVEQLGVPQRVFQPNVMNIDFPRPAIVPPIKVSDFSFTALTDAV